MNDFSFVKSKSSGKWVILAPKRAKRPDQANGKEPPCPFEPGFEQEIYSLNQVRVVNNKFPFAPIHEIIIHSDDHHKNFDELTHSQAEDIIKTFHQRFVTHKERGQVYIFHNQGKNAGESLPHPHTQLVVIPNDIELEIPVLKLTDEEVKETACFYIFCPNTSQWPDEVWIAPKKEGRLFSEATEEELMDLAFTLKRTHEILDLRYGHDFSFNFYIYPGNGWYLRLIPRIKILGGFEVGTNVFVNTQVPNETFAFIKEHFDNPDHEKIKLLHQADYTRSV
ncbi:MAG: HIT domain-containing protein [Patescibacteria group bacterium]